MAYGRKNSLVAIWLLIMPITHHLLDAKHANAQFPMPLEKFLPRSRKVFILGCADTRTTEMRVVFGASEP